MVFLNLIPLQIFCLYHKIFYLLSSKTQFLVSIRLNCTCRLWHCDFFCSISWTVPTLSYHIFTFFHTLPSSHFPFPSRALFRAHQIIQKEINLTKIAHSLGNQTIHFGSIKAILWWNVYQTIHLCNPFGLMQLIVSSLCCPALGDLIHSGGFLFFFENREYLSKKVSQ